MYILCILIFAIYFLYNTSMHLQKERIQSVYYFHKYFDPTSYDDCLRAMGISLNDGEELISILMMLVIVKN